MDDRLHSPLSIHLRNDLISPCVMEGWRDGWKTDESEQSTAERLPGILENLHWFCSHIAPPSGYSAMRKKASYPIQLTHLHWSWCCIWPEANGGNVVFINWFPERIWVPSLTLKQTAPPSYELVPPSALQQPFIHPIHKPIGAAAAKGAAHAVVKCLAQRHHDRLGELDLNRQPFGHTKPPSPTCQKNDVLAKKKLIQTWWVASIGDASLICSQLFTWCCRYPNTSGERYSPRWSYPENLHDKADCLFFFYMNCEWMLW